MFEIVIREVVEVEERTRAYQKLHDKEDFNTKEDPQYGYIYADDVVKKERVVLRQEVEELDIKFVIKAINGIL